MTARPGVSGAEAGGRGEVAGEYAEGGGDFCELFGGAVAEGGGEGVVDGGGPDFGDAAGEAGIPPRPRHACGAGAACHGAGAPLLTGPGREEFGPGR